MPVAALVLVIVFGALYLITGVGVAVYFFRGRFGQEFRFTMRACGRIVRDGLAALSLAIFWPLIVLGVWWATASDERERAKNSSLAAD